jgi:APA family basic amino acid/polyamine antiporter
LGVVAFFALGATPIALGLAGFVFICTALTYAEMTATFHESGGSASFARHAFNDLISFIAGWGLLLDYVVTIAISAFAVGPYLGYFFPIFGTVDVQIGFTLCIILILFLINLRGVKQSTHISLWLTSATVFIQLIVILIGLFTILNLPYLIDHLRVGISNSTWSPSWHDFWIGVAMAMVAYTGIESIAQLAAESHRPARTVPRAVVLTMCVLVCIYLGLSLVALSAISPHDLGTKYINNPVAGIVDALPIGSAILSPCVALIAAIVLFVAANAGLMGASRLCFNMGEYYQLPRMFYRLHSRYRTPFIALAFFAIIAGLVVVVSRGQLIFLADLYNFGAMIAFTSAHLSLIVLRIKKPHLHRPFKIPFNIRFGNAEVPITAILGCLATISVWFLVVLTKPYGRYLGLAWISFGLLLYYSYRKKKKLQLTGSVTLEQIKVPGYSHLKIKHILVFIRSGTEMETVQSACEMAKLYHAKMTVIQVLELAPSLPLDSPIPHRVNTAEILLKRAEAIANEHDVAIDLKLIRSRSIASTIIEMTRSRKYDLLILGAMKLPTESHVNIASLAREIVSKARCRVWVLANIPRTP